MHRDTKGGLRRTRKTACGGSRKEKPPLPFFASVRGRALAQGPERKASMENFFKVNGEDCSSPSAETSPPAGDFGFRHCRNEFYQMFGFTRKGVFSANFNHGLMRTPWKLCIAKYAPIMDIPHTRRASGPARMLQVFYHNFRAARKGLGEISVKSRMPVAGFVNSDQQGSRDCSAEFHWLRAPHSRLAE